MKKMLAPVVVLDKTRGAVTLYDSDGQEVVRGPDGTAVALHGVGVLGDRLVTSSTDLAAWAAQTDETSMVRSWERSARGSLCAYVLRPDSVLVLPDAMGTATLFTLDHVGYSIATSSMASLVATASDLRIDLDKNLEYGLEVAFLGGGALSQTSHIGVERVEPFDYVVTSNRMERRQYAVADWFWNQKVPVLELFEQYLDDVQSAVRAAAEGVTSNVGVSHLTGGLDSRLVLAALVDQGLEHQFAYYTVGPRGTRDRDIAEGIERSLGLTPTEFSGVRSATFDSPVDASVAALVRTGGMTRQGPSGFEEETSNVVLGGGHGELARSFYASRAPSFDPASYDRDQLALQIFGNSIAGSYDESRSVLKKDARNRFLDRFDLFLRSASQKVQYPDYVLDSLYIHARNRNHIGLIQLSTSEFSHRVDPLYSLAGAKLAQSVPVAARSAGLLLFDMLDRLAPRLLEFAFDSPKFGDDVWNVRRRPTPREFSGDLKPALASPGAAQHVPATHGPLAAAAKREDVIRLSAKINAPFWQVNLFDQAAHAIRSHLADDSTGIVQYINPTGVRWLLNNGLTHKSYVRQVIDLYTTLRWLDVSA
jgi:hypothetical protein